MGRSDRDHLPAGTFRDDIGAAAQLLDTGIRAVAPAPTKFRETTRPHTAVAPMQTYREVKQTTLWVSDSRRLPPRMTVSCIMLRPDVLGVLIRARSSLVVINAQQPALRANVMRQGLMKPCAMSAVVRAIAWQRSRTPQNVLNVAAVGDQRAQRIRMAGRHAPLPLLLQKSVRNAPSARSWCRHNPWLMSRYSKMA